MKFDLEKTAELERLFAVPREERADTWREAFFAAVPDASLETTERQVEAGPDGFPYFVLRMPQPGPFETFCLNHVLDACLENGFGIAVQGSDAEPEWVFTYGDLWSFKQTGRFVVSTGEPVTITERRSASVGTPDETMLPAYARRVLGGVLRDAGVSDPGVFLVQVPGMDPLYSFAFHPVPENARWLLWFIPRHFGMMKAQDGWGDPLPL